MTDREYEQLARRIEVTAEETRRHFDVVAERLESQMRLIAEGVLTVDQKIERTRQEVGSEFDEVKAMMRSRR